MAPLVGQKCFAILVPDFSFLVQNFAELSANRTAEDDPNGKIIQ